MFTHSPFPPGWEGEEGNRRTKVRNLVDGENESKQVSQKPSAHLPGQLLSNCLSQLPHFIIHHMVWDISLGH